MSSDKPVDVSETSYNKDLGSKDREIVADLVMRANNHLRKSALEVIEFGKILLQLKELLDGKGTFVLCVKEEFEMTKTTAAGYMNVATTFGNISPDSETGKIILRLSPTVLVKLAAPSTSSEVISEVFDLVRAGNKVKVDDVKRLINKVSKSANARDDSETKDVFDDPDEADRQDIRLMEEKLKERMENLIKELDQVANGLTKLYKKVPNKKTFFEKASLFFTFKTPSAPAAKRVLLSLMSPEKVVEFFKGKVAETTS